MTQAGLDTQCMLIALGVDTATYPRKKRNTWRALDPNDPSKTFVPVI